MKTNSHSKRIKIFVAFVMVFLWTTLAINAQCPTIVDPTPAPICDASGFTFADLSTPTYVTDNGNGIAWFTSLTGGAAIPDTQLVSEGTFYVDDDSGSCALRTSITVNFQVNPTGQSLDGIYCSNENPTIQTYIDDVLQSNMPPSGAIEVYEDFELTILANGTDPIPSGRSFYYIVFVDNGGCKSQLEIGSTAIFDSPSDPTPASTQMLCSDANPTIADLDPGTIASYSWYANIDGFGDPILPALSSSSALVDGATYYVQVDELSCDSNAVPVTVTIDAPNNPGTSSSLEYCTGSLPSSDFDLFDELGGPKDTIGVWTGPLTTSNGHLGTVNISTLTTAGVYTFIYTVPSNGACPESTANVVITIYQTLTSGTIAASNPATFCEQDLSSSFDLSTLLDNEDTGGQWTQGTLSTDPIVTSPIDLTSLTPGTYDFTYTQNVFPNPCTEESTTVQVEVLQDPEAGNAINQVFCENDLVTNSPFNLFDALDGSQDNNGGTWADAGSNVVSNSIDITGFTVSGSPYLFTYTLSNGTCDDTETISITVDPAPESGTANTPVEYCEGAGPTSFDLYTLIDGESGTGTWTNNNTSTTVVDPTNINLSILLVDTYSFTFDIDPVGSCDDIDVDVSIVINPLPNTGNANNPPPFCENDPALSNSTFDLFTILSGTVDSGGTWTDDSINPVSGVLSANILDLSQLLVDTYNFTYSITDSNTCTNSTTVSITIEEAPESGTPIASFPEFCEGAAPSSYNLFDLLDNENQTGVWYIGSDNSGSTTTNLVDLSGLTPATYDFTFDVDAIGSCDDELVTVQIVINPLPNSGNANNPAPICENNPVLENTFYNIRTYLAGEDAGGTWFDDDNTGAIVGPSRIDYTQLGIGTYNFTYTVTDANSCSSSTTITIQILDAPESGTPIADFPEFCEGAASSSYNLFDLLDNEDQTGVWYIGSDNSGSTITNPIDLSILTPATYDFTFDVDAIGSCDDPLVTVSIIINPLPETGTPTAAIFCENELVSNSPLDLFGQLSGEDTGGTWTDDNITGALTGSDVDLTILAIGSYNFTYSITDVNSCTSSSTVVVTVEDAPESGNAIAPFEICEENVTANSPFDLFTLLDGTQDTNGTWYLGLDTSGAVTLNTVDISTYTDGTYSFTYSVPDIGTCSDVDVTVQIIVFPTPETGTPTAATFCENELVSNSPLDLFGQLSGEDAGGTWTDDNTTGALAGSDVDLTTLAIGTYNFTYSITDVNGCTSSSTVVVTVEDAPESGTVNTPLEVCLSDIGVVYVVDLFSLLDGEDQTGTWNDDDTTGGLTGNVVNISGLSTGTYNFTYNVDAIGSCDDVDLTVSIIISDTPAPTAAASQEFCDGATVADLIATGTAIQWYDVATGGTALVDTAALVDGEDYYATQTDGTTGCESSVRTIVTATIYQSPNAGALAVTPIITCNNTTIDLTLGLDGSQDTGGVWYEGSDNTGTVVTSSSSYDVTGLSANTYQFTYYVTASSPCIDDSITISVTIDELLDVGTDGPLQDLCSNNGPVDLFTQLGGTPDTGGTWSPALTSGTGVFDPLIDAPTTYTYTLTNACGTFSSEVQVSVTQAPNAGIDNQVSICVIDGVTDLFSSLGNSAQSGGTWSPALTSGTGEFDPAMDTAGVYTYTLTAISPCTADAVAQITVTVDDSNAPLVVDANPQFCIMDNPTVLDLNNALTITGTVNWYEDAALTTLANTTDSLVDGEDYYATQTNSSGCESSTNVSVIVTINETPTPTLINSNQELCISDNPILSELTSNINFSASSYSVAWYDSDVGGSVVSESSLLSVGETYYAVLIDVTTGCESAVRLDVTPDLTSCGDLVIPDGFSPNDDGVNDTFDVDNLAILYPNFELEIYNRNGNLVYKGNANSPRFDGTSNQSRVVAKGDLPVGVYFYIFNYNDGENNPEQGRLYLSR